MTLQRFQLGNGLTVLVAPNPGAPVAALQAWVGVGSTDEPRRLAGISHVFEHMLFKGTPGRGVGDIAREVESAGGEINAWTSFDQTVYHVVLASRYFDTALEILADALQNSSFDPAELEREREVILEEIRHADDDPMRNVAQNLFSTAFVRHPYRFPVIGDAARIGRMRREHLVEFFETWYVAGNITLAIAGDVEPGPVRARVERAFGNMRAGSVRRRRHREPAQRQPRVHVATQDVSEAFLALGFHIPALRSERTPALDVAAVVLGQGESARLQASVRRDRELVSGVHAYAHSLRDPGLLIVGATLAPDRLEEAMEAIATETARLAVEEVGPRELEKARHAIAADAVYELETAEGTARKLGFYEAVAGDAGFETTYLEALRRVTPAAVREAVAAHVADDAITVSAVIPDQDRRRVPALSRALPAAFRRGARRARKRYSVPVSAGGPLRTQLENGLTLLIQRDRSVPVVAMRAVWTGGLRLETARTSGISHLLAATITRGLADLPADRVAEAVDDMAGTLAGFAGRNSFGVRAEWLSDTWERGLELVTGALTRPWFADADVEREKRRTLDDLEARADDPTAVAFRAFAETMYRRHPYRMDMLGSAESLAALDADALRRHYRRHYPLSAVTLAVVGDVDPARVLDLAREGLGAEAARGRPERQPPVERFVGRSARARQVRRHLVRQQAQLIIGFPGTTLHDPDRYGLEILTSILGGQGGRLFIELRDRQALAYRVGAYSIEGLDPGYLAVYLSCHPDKLAAAQDGIRRELERITARGVTRAEVTRAARYLVGTHEIALQRRSAVAAALAFHEAYGLGYDRYLRYAHNVRAVTASQVAAAARRFFDWDQAVTAVVQPPEDD